MELLGVVGFGCSRHCGILPCSAMDQINPEDLGTTSHICLEVFPKWYEVLQQELSSGH